MSISEDAELDTAIELLRDAYAVIDGIPARRIALYTWQSPRGMVKYYPITAKFKKTADEIDCGTLACAAGWLCLHPKFQELGLRVSREGDPTLADNARVHGFDALARVFHITEPQAYRLFRLASAAPVGQHKSIWLDRCLNLIAQLQLSKSNSL